ncbi:hypothetical protein MIND_00708800 [Mycena indigotica]|uniref:Uncharacterized protein n=1 Tax=Mycena indigotica TaxID=2126181 RepID=A0A8H6SP64_9AGAR|nr:uncharacterized protein MIND_00708800 [Mycena indigotica]KAF7301435.1 hypothetical protein MIND_00708800 [Mycena indigotica]
MTARLTGLRPLFRLLQVANVSTAPPIDRVRQTNFDLLRESLELEGNPSRVWANYTNLVSFLGSEPLPFHVHQQVLRKCTPPSSTLRASATRRILVGNVPQSPHVYEGRFIAVIRNMRAAGYVPTLEDYNFILEQFAAVGHHFGVMHVYRELTSLGVVPRSRTFGLCLQAIAHRLTLPVNPAKKRERTETTRRMISDLITAMKTHNIPFTSANLDLSMRILRESTDMDGFELLMKWAYGIDLANPDCTPVEYLEGKNPSPPQPFSTDALNMTLETLGRLRDISRLVQAFEVLTTPLPKRPSSANDEEEDDFGIRHQPSLPLPTPSASPNTTSYNILIRHLSQAGHATLARHYLIQAIKLERETSHLLWKQLGNRRRQLQHVLSPHFSINRGTFLSVYGESNRDKNAGLMRWLFSKMPSVIKRKQGNLDGFLKYRALRQQRGLWPYDGSEVKDTTTLRRAPTEPASPLAIGDRWRAPDYIGNVFDIDINSETPLPLPPAPKKLDLDLHISILERDIRELSQLRDHVEQMLTRTTHRIKQRLGRRVAGKQDIYLATEVQENRDRVRIDPKRWSKIANFRSVEVAPGHVVRTKKAAEEP